MEDTLANGTGIFDETGCIASGGSTVWGPDLNGLLTDSSGGGPIAGLPSTSKLGGNPQPTRPRFYALWLAYCSAVPAGRLASVQGSAGTLGGVTGSLDVVTNYGSGEVSGFTSGGGFAGFTGGGSITASYGIILGNLSPDNSSFSGPFTTTSGSLGILGGNVATSSGGLSAPLKSTGTTVISGSAGLTLFGPFTFTGSITNTSKGQLRMGNFVKGTTPPLSPYDLLFYALRQPCT
jgi:hypothetical protein